MDETIRRLQELSDHLVDPEIVPKVIEALPDALIIVNEMGRIVIANSQAELLFGYPRSAMKDQPVEMLMPQSVRERHVAHREGYVEDPRVRRMGEGMVLTAQHRSGKEFQVEINLSPVVTGHGTSTIAIIRKVKPDATATEHQ